MTTKLIHLAAQAMLSVLLAVTVGALAVVTVIPRAVHGAALTVLTGSMTPTIPVGSTVVVRPVDPGTLRVGDIITYQQKPGKASYITHRIVAIHEDTQPATLTTKGDANRGEDTQPVPVTAVRGKVLFHVPYVGTLRNALSIRHGGLWLVILGLMGYAVRQLVEGLRHRDAETGRDSTPLASPIYGSGVAVPPLTLQMLVVTLPIVEFEGLVPHQVAQLLRMDLLDESVDQFTLVVTREPDQVQQLTTLLLPFKPLTLVRSESVEVPWCRPTVPDRFHAGHLAVTGGAHGAP